MKPFQFLLLSSFTLMFIACGSVDVDTPPTSSTSSSEVAIGAVVGSIQSGDTSGTIALLNSGKETSLFPWFKLLLPSASASGSICPNLQSQISACSVGTSSFSLRYQSCVRGGLGTWTGEEIFAFSNGATCTQNPALNTSGNMLRTFSSGTYRISPNGEKVVMDTASSTGWQSAKSGGFYTSYANGSSDLAIRGIHYVAYQNYKASNGSTKTATVWDQTVSSDTAIHVTGTGANRVVTGGVIRIQDNQRKVTGVTSITSSLLFSADCCFPTGGTISTTFSGGRTGTESLTFASTCGSAQYQSRSGAVSSITLQHCL